MIKTLAMGNTIGNHIESYTCNGSGDNGSCLENRGNFVFNSSMAKQRWTYLMLGVPPKHLKNMSIPNPPNTFITTDCQRI